MKANELRINNLISHNGLICTVEIINGELNEIYFLGKDFYYSDKTENLDVIPLTDEWLLKFGFEKESNKSYSTGEEIVYSVYRLDELTYNSIQKNWWFNGVLSNQPIYVHQLQNLYYALTGEELTII